MLKSNNSLIGGHNGHKSFNFIFQYDNKQEKWEKLNEVALVKERAYHAVSLLDVCSLTPLTNESYCGCKKEIGENESSATIETTTTSSMVFKNIEIKIVKYLDFSINDSSFKYKKIIFFCPSMFV